MSRFISYLFGKIGGLLNNAEAGVLFIVEFAYVKNVFGWLLLTWCFLVIFIFYPYALSLETNIILKQGIFIFGGILSLGIIFLSALYRRIRFSNKGLFLSLLFIAIASAISTILTVRPENAITGLIFEQDTLAVTLGFILVIIASALSFRDWPGDLGLLIVKIVGIGLILPAAILRSTVEDTYWQYLYIDNLSLQVLSIISIIVSVYQLDFNRSLNWLTRSYLFLLIIAALAICYGSPHFALLGVGLGLVLYLAFQSLARAKIMPLTGLFVGLAFGLLIIVSFNQTNQPQSTLYLREISFLHQALAYSFQWGDINPWWGMGPHTYTAFWDIYRPYDSYQDNLWPVDYEPPYIYNQPNYAFGLVPTFVVNTGFFGLLSWLAFLIFSSYLARRRLKKITVVYDRSVPVALIVIYSLLVILLETPQVYVLAVLALSLGALAALEVSSIANFSPKNIYRSLRLFSVLFLIIGLSAALVLTQKIVSTSLIFQKTVDLWLDKSDGVGLPILDVEEGVKKYPQPEHYRVLAQIQFYSARNFLLKNTSLSEDDDKYIRKLLGDSVINASKAAEMNGTDFRNWLLLGDISTFIFIFGAVDADDLAEAHYNKALTLLNIQPLAYYGLARLAHIKDERDIALQNIEESLRVRPNWGEALKLKEEIINQ